MILILDENGKVSLRTNKPTEEQRAIGIQVDNIPEPTQIAGKDAILYFSESEGVYYEYVNRPLTADEEMQKMKEKQDLMQKAIDDLILGGAL